MVFCVSAQCGQARCGVLSTVRGTIKCDILTPCFTDLTNCGALLHITSDVAQTSMNHAHGRITQLNIFDFIDISKSFREHNRTATVPVNLRNFIHANGNQNNLLFATFRHPLNHVSVPSTDNHATGPTGAGNKKLTPEEHVDLIKLIDPDFFVALSDEVGASDGANRKKRCVERTTKWFDRSVQACEVTTSHDEHHTAVSALSPAQCAFACLQGADDVRLRDNSTTEFTKREKHVFGVAIGGLWAGESEAERKLVLEHVVPRLPANKPRFLPGALTPAETLKAIELGFDIFEGTYVAFLTRQGLAATFAISPPQESAKRRKLEHDTLPTAAAATTTTTITTTATATEQSASKICLFDKSFALDQLPILPGCECYTCKNHTRAYLHHLVVCQEMTGNILLDLHNTWHLDAFMVQVRNAIRDDKLAEYSEWFCSSASSS